MASGCSVTSGSGTCTPIPHTCATLPSACPFTTLQQTKADATVVTAVQNARNLKADSSDMITLQAGLDNLAVQIGASDPEPEVTPPRPRALTPVGGELCVPWGPAEPATAWTPPARRIRSG